MVRLGIVSDTHKDLGALKKALEQMGKINYLLHGGDHYQDARQLTRMANIPVEAVVGNCDWLGPGGPEELVLQYEQVKILLTHGHRYRVKYGYDLLLERALELGVKAAVFGHTHQAYQAWQQGVLLFNPGSLAFPRGGGKPTFGILSIEKGYIQGEIRELEI